MSSEDHPSRGSEGAKTHEGGRHVLSGEYRMADGQAVRKTAESYRTLRGHDGLHDYRSMLYHRSELGTRAC